jgi:hypothetical protein
LWNGPDECYGAKMLGTAPEDPREIAVRIEVSAQR